MPGLSGTFNSFSDRSMKKKNASVGFYFLAITILGFVFYEIYEFSRFDQTPQGMQGIVQSLEGLGLCLGFVLLCCVIFVLISYFSAKKDEAKPPLSSKEYPVRCELQIPPKTSGDSGSPGQPVSNDPQTVRPIYLLISTTYFGLSLAPFPMDKRRDFLDAGNTTRYRALSLNRPGRIILPVGCSSLSYTLTHPPAENSEIDPSPETRDGPLPPDSGDDLIEIVITFTAILEAENITHLIYLDQGQKIQLAAIDEAGRETPEMTRQLYETVYPCIYPPDSSYENSY
jgi:hypothetical protein